MIEQTYLNEKGKLSRVESAATITVSSMEEWGDYILVTPVVTKCQVPVGTPFGEWA